MGKKMYFCGSIRGGRQDVDLYAKIIEEMKNYGTVLTEHVGQKNVSESEEPLTSKQIHDRDMRWLSQSDVIVAEVTQPSLGVGYEIGRAVSMNKPILCLFRPDSGKLLSCMIEGMHNGNDFIVKHYSGKDEDFKDILKEFLA